MASPPARIMPAQARLSDEQRRSLPSAANAGDKVIRFRPAPATPDGPLPVLAILGRVILGDRTISAVLIGSL